MDTVLVRIKPYDPRRGHVLRRFTYRGMKICEDQSWRPVNEDVAEHLRGVRQSADDDSSPLAFDMCGCTEEQGASTGPTAAEPPAAEGPSSGIEQECREVRQTDEGKLEALRQQYQSGTKLEKGRILDEFVAHTGYHRKHVVRLLRRDNAEPSEDCPTDCEPES